MYIIFQLRKRVKLEGKELEEYLEKEKLKKEAAKKLEQSKEWVPLFIVQSHTYFWKWFRNVALQGGSMSGISLT